MPAIPTKVWLLLAIPLLLKLFRSKRLPSRETIILPSEERVLLLGASSGVGRDLALAYAKRGARICLVARTEKLLQQVKQECLDLGAEDSKIILCPGDVTSTTDLLGIRDTILKAWSGIDTVHILAGVPSTSTLLDIAQVPLSTPQSPSTSSLNPLQKRTFGSAIGDKQGSESKPTQDGLDKVAAEARACGEVNYVGTVLALACFLPTLSSTSKSPVLHHLSSVAATIPAPCRALYSATKAAAFMAVESCRVECEGSGVRFFSFLPGTIANGFRLKHAVNKSGGRDETALKLKDAWGESLLLQPEEVVNTVLHHLSLNPAPAPLIPYFPLSLIPSLQAPPKAVVHHPAMYYWATLMSWTPLGWGYVEPSARRKYGLPP